MFFRHAFFSFIKIILLSLLVLTKVQAASLPWIIDEQSIVPSKVIESMGHVLGQTASNRNIHLRVVVINIQQENVKELIHQKVIEYKNKVPHQVQGITSFLVINLGTNQSYIFLGNDLSQTQSMIQNLKHVQKEIILPALEQQELVNALTQGAIAITTVLYTHPKMLNATTLWQSTNAWLSDHNLLLPSQILFWLTMLFAIWWGLKRYLNRPQFEAQAVDMEALQERMILNSLALRQEYNDSFFDRSP